MSIIHDALKKVQTDLNQKNHQEIPTAQPIQHLKKPNLPSQDSKPLSLPTPTASVASTPPSTQYFEQSPAAHLKKNIHAGTSVSSNTTQHPTLAQHPVASGRNFFKALFLVTGLFILFFSWRSFIQPQNPLPSLPADSVRQNLIPPTPTIQAISKPDDHPLMIVSGIMATNDKHVALINDAIYEVGEEIEGLRILEITMEKVQMVDIDSGKIKTFKVTKK
jgi:hypothetical protein